MRLQLGTAVRCLDGEAGMLADLVIDPHARRVTHLVVEPKGRHALARLVQVELAARDDEPGPGLALACTKNELHRLPEIHELAFLGVCDFPVQDPAWDVGIHDVLVLPSPDFPGLGWNPGDGEPRLTVAYDRVPKGEVEIRGTSEVTSADGHDVGHVEGCLVDVGERITHVVLQRGRAWGRRELTIPIGAVAHVETDSIRLSLDKDAVGALPSVPVHGRLARGHRRTGGRAGQSGS